MLERILSKSLGSLVASILLAFCLALVEWWKNSKNTMVFGPDAQLTYPVWMALVLAFYALLLALLWAEGFGQKDERFRNFMPSFLSIALIFALSPPFLLMPSQLAIIPALFAVRSVFQSIDNSRNFYRLFDAGLLLGLAALISLHYLWVFPWIMAVSIFLGNTHWRHLSIPFLGLIFVFWVQLAVGQFWGTTSLDKWILAFEKPYINKNIFFNNQTSLIRLILFVPLLPPIVRDYLERAARGSTAWRRKILNALMAGLLYFLLLWLFLPQNGQTWVTFLALSSGILLSGRIERYKKKWSKRLILLYILFIAIIEIIWL